MTDLTKRAEEEVAKELAPFTQTGMSPREQKTYALAVRLMRYKLGVEEAKEGMREEEKSYGEQVARCREYGLKAQGDRLEALQGCTQYHLDILTRHTQEEGR